MGVIDPCINGCYGHMHVVRVVRKREEERLEQECDLCNIDLIIQV